MNTCHRVIRSFETRLLLPWATTITINVAKGTFGKTSIMLTDAIPKVINCAKSVWVMLTTWKRPVLRFQCNKYFSIWIARNKQGATVVDLADNHLDIVGP